jgi:streptomycin 6-kinase
VKEVVVMNIPEAFRDKMIRTFGEDGRRRVAKLPEIIEACIEKWNLTECIPLSNLSYNYICFVKSTSFGDGVLKIGVDAKELSSEINALNLYQGNNICKCYDYAPELGAFIIERIVPGEDLTSVKDLSTRISIAADLISKLPVKVEKEESKPSYTEWIDRAFSLARSENIVGKEMLHFIDEAETYFADIQSGDIQKVLLHGDLHHYNILQSQDGTWKAIDPKGVVGISYFECGAFIENQLDMVSDVEKLFTLKEMIAAFSDKFCETEITIGKALFINTVLRTCWTFEENPSQDEISEGVSRCALIYNYINELIS